MKKKWMAVVMVWTLLISLFGLAVNTVPAEAASESSAISAGDIVTFGTYPKTEVKDTALLEKLKGEVSGKTFTAYPYTSKNESFDYNTGQTRMVRNPNIMSYYDFTYAGQKYRAVKLNYYRPAYVWGEVGVNSRQDLAGYFEGNTYYFRWEPIEWIVLDPESGFLLSKNGVDGQAFCEWFLYGTQFDYTMKSSDYPATDYYFATIRDWLSPYSFSYEPYKTEFNFLHTAFTSQDLEAIKPTLIKSDYSGGSREDLVFLLSESEFTQYKSVPGVIQDGFATDYALSQGCGKAHYWTLRSKASAQSRILLVNGDRLTDTNTDFAVKDSILSNIRPAVKVNLSSPSVKPVQSEFPVQVRISTWDKDGKPTAFSGGTAKADRTTVRRGDLIEVTYSVKSGYALDDIDFGCNPGERVGFQHGLSTSARVPDTFVSSDGNFYINVTFRQQVYSVTVNYGMSNVEKAAFGEDIIIRPERPHTGYAFDKWVVNRGRVNLLVSSSGAATFTMPSENVELTATYKKIPRVMSASAKYSSITKSAIQEFTVATTSDVNYLMLYAEDGSTLVKSWAAAGNSTVNSDGKRTWNVSQAIGTAGDRKLVFQGGTTSTTPVTNAVTVPFKVENTGVISASVKNATIKKGGTQEFTVRTTSDATYLMLYAEGGNLVKTWTANSSNSKVSGNVRTWTVTQSIGTAGKRDLILKAGKSSTPTSAQRTVSFTVEDTWVNEASVSYATIGKGGMQTFTVKTTAAAQNLMLYAEGGNLVKTWPASGNSTISGDVRTWTVKLAIGTAGNRELTLKAGKTTTPSPFGKSVKFTVAEKKLLSAKAKYNAITKASMQGFTVTTTADVKYLMLYAEGGNLVKSWAASGNSTVAENNIRTWNVIQEIGSTGDRKLVFKGGTTNTTPVTNASTVSFKVVSSGVLTASAKNATMNKGTTQTFTVTTTADCNYLAEYAESGNLVTTWTANSSNSKVSGNVRTWTVTQTIGTAGKRTLMFKAGKNSAVTAAERSVSFTVK